MKDFVGGVSEKLIAQSKADPGRAYLVAGYIYMRMTYNLDEQLSTLSPSFGRSKPPSTSSFPCARMSKQRRSRWRRACGWQRGTTPRR